MALADLDLFEEERLDQRVLDDEGAFRVTLEKLLDLPVVGDVRGDGYSHGIGLVEDRATAATRSSSPLRRPSTARPGSTRWGRSSAAS